LWGGDSSLASTYSYNKVKNTYKVSTESYKSSFSPSAARSGTLRKNTPTQYEQDTYKISNNYLQSKNSRQQNTAKISKKPYTIRILGVQNENAYIRRGYLQNR